MMFSPTITTTAISNKSPKNVVDLETHDEFQLLKVRETSSSRTAANEVKPAGLFNSLQISSTWPTDDHDQQHECKPQEMHPDIIIADVIKNPATSLNKPPQEELVIDNNGNTNTNNNNNKNYSYNMTTTLSSSTSTSNLSHDTHTLAQLYQSSRRSRHSIISSSSSSSSRKRNCSITFPLKASHAHQTYAPTLTYSSSCHEMMTTRATTNNKNSATGEQQEQQQQPWSFHIPPSPLLQLHNYVSSSHSICSSSMENEEFELMSSQDVFLASEDIFDVDVDNVDNVDNNVAPLDFVDFGSELKRRKIAPPAPED